MSEEEVKLTTTDNSFVDNVNTTNLGINVVNEEETITTTYEQDMDKYTKIDNLDEDNGDLQYILVSFVSPEKVMNCNIRGLKVRHYRNKPAVFSDYALAQKAAQELNEKEKYFDIFVMPTGRWCAWDPSPDDRTKVESEKWANKDQQALMDNLEKMNLEKQKKDLSELNALVGKKKDLVEQSTEQHKERIAHSIKQGIEEKNTVLPEINKSSTEKQSSQTQSELSNNAQPAKKTHNNKNIKEHLRRKLEEKRQREAAQNKNTTSPSTTVLSNELKEEVMNQEQLENNINKAKAILEKLQNKTS
jgi:hypothetical protein